MNDWINSYISKVDRIWVTGRRKLCCVARLQEEVRHDVSKIRRAVGMKIIIEDSKRSNIL